MTTAVRFEVRKASPRLGAEIAGGGPGRRVDDETAQALREAFLAYKVLVFRGQHLSPSQHVEAVRIFDEPFDHPTAVHRHAEDRLVYVYDLPKAGAAAHWHVGGLWRNPPFSIESLTYQVVPEVGGRTLWADLRAAYDDLSEPLKQHPDPHLPAEVPWARSAPSGGRPGHRDAGRRRRRHPAQVS